MKNKKPVLVTTAHKGVFFGYVAPGANLDVKSIKIANARMAIYWSSDLKGVFGLASSGPNHRCRISPAVPSLVLQDITAIVEATLEAAEAWEKAPWQ